MKNLAIVLFGCACFAQWFIPAKMIVESEDVISSGTQMKFETEPVDPSDPFRGKYITLGYKADKIETTRELEQGEEVYITFSNNTKGFAEPSELLTEKPAVAPYLTTIIKYRPYRAENDSLQQKPVEIYLEFPFDRLYLEESKAEKAEYQYREAQRDTLSNTYALVRMGEGNAILIDVLINEKSIVDIVKELNSKE